MPLMTLSIQHRHTFDDARRHLESAVREITSRSSFLIKREEWSADRSQVRLEGMGFLIDMRVDAQAVYASADLPGLGRFLGDSVTTRLKKILHRTFQQKLPDGAGKA